jgi:ribonuclease P protein component
MKLFGFSQKERIRKKKEFLEIMATGQKRQTTHFIIYLKPNSKSFSRLGITVSRRVGEAVQRNRIKRLLREFFRVHKQRLPQTCDFIIIAKKGANQLSYHQLKRELIKLAQERL